GPDVRAGDGRQDAGRQGGAAAVPGLDGAGVGDGAEGAPGGRRDAGHPGHAPGLRRGAIGRRAAVAGGDHESV
ncbi:MAG: hypothetical protein AVDCRST_MAG88-3692, partial [uncultured Thermomicrobiales bacterium]